MSMSSEPHVVIPESLRSYVAPLLNNKERQREREEQGGKERFGVTSECLLTMPNLDLDHNCGTRSYIL